ncbi:MAG: hypothetical protein HZA54_18515, partial [Planctomycetes bacterium]|nr:hypothetical protein [Planctomycetota bacterium]
MTWRFISATLAAGLARGFHAPAFDDAEWTPVRLPFEFSLHGLPPRGWFRGRLSAPARITGCDSHAVLFADGVRVALLEGPYDACVVQGAIALYVEERPERADWVTALLRPVAHSDVYGWKRT